VHVRARAQAHRLASSAAASAAAAAARRPPDDAPACARLAAAGCALLATGAAALGDAEEASVRPAEEKTVTLLSAPPGAIAAATPLLAPTDVATAYVTARPVSNRLRRAAEAAATTQPLEPTAVCTAAQNWAACLAPKEAGL